MNKIFFYHTSAIVNIHYYNLRPELSYTVRGIIMSQKEDLFSVKADFSPNFSTENGDYLRFFEQSLKEKAIPYLTSKGEDLPKSEVNNATIYYFSPICSMISNKQTEEQLKSWKMDEIFICSMTKTCQF